MGSTETFIQMLESATLEPARCCSACHITEQGFLARDEMATGICRSGWSLSSCFALPSSDERSRQKSKGSTRQLVSLETEWHFRLKPNGLRIEKEKTSGTDNKLPETHYINPFLLARNDLVSIGRSCGGAWRRNTVPSSVPADLVRNGFLYLCNIS